MEENLESPYSVLTKDDLKAKMNKQIDETSNIFLVSKSVSTVLHMLLKWDSHKVSESLSENKDKLLSESGLNSALFGNDNDEAVGSKQSCGICLKTCDEIVHGLVTSTMFCSHKFCRTCLREYLEKKFYSLEKNLTVVSCPDEDCRGAVGIDTMEKLSLYDQDKFEEYVLRSYSEENKVLNIKTCPRSDCECFIEFHEDENDEEHSLNVVCICGHTFCWRCKLESHRPVTCNNASDWLSTVLPFPLDELSKLPSRGTSVKKPCPYCFVPVDLSGGKYFRFLTCNSCEFRFCWKCMKLEESHKTETGLYRACVAPESGRAERESSSVESVDRWKDCQKTMKAAKCDLNLLERRIVKEPNVLREEDITTFREGLMLVVQCKQVLKWTCAYDYFHTEYEISKKEYLRFLQDNATTALESYVKHLSGEIKRAFSAKTYEDLGNLKDRLNTATSNIGNYFYHFIKNLQDGLVDVKVNSYDGLAGQYWYCDRCTYGNTWLDKECKMCCDSSASTNLEELTGLSIN